MSNFEGYLAFRCDPEGQMYFQVTRDCGHIEFEAPISTEDIVGIHNALGEYLCEHGLANRTYRIQKDLGILDLLEKN